jgi:hypothetical protein
MWRQFLSDIDKSVGQFRNSPFALSLSKGSFFELLGLYFAVFRWIVLHRAY